MTVIILNISLQFALYSKSSHCVVPESIHVHALHFPLFSFSVHQQPLLKHLHKCFSIRLAWGDLAKLVIVIKNECASSMRRTGTVSPEQTVY